MTAPRLHSDPFLPLKWRCALGRFERKLHLWLAAAVKGGFDPNQPRVPAGNPRGGQWTDGGGGQALSDASPDNFWKPDAQLAQAKKPKESGKPKKTRRRRLKVPTVPRSQRRSGSPGPQPKVPLKRPTTVHQRNRIAKDVAKWLSRASKLPVPGQARVFLTVVEGAVWLYDHYDDIEAYLDPPKTLKELQRAAKTRRPGHERHHIVEQTPARQDGFPRSMIDDPENVVSISKLKHREISGHYQRKHKDLGFKSPRNHLRGKSWAERQELGIDTLRLFEVLGP